MNLRTFLSSPLGLLYTDRFIFWWLSKRRKHAWIVSAPKSGSTWLAALLAESLRWKTVELVPGYDMREQEIDLRQLMLCSRSANVLTPNQHCRCSRVTEEIVRKANIKVIFQLRDIFDTVVSFRDHFNNESVRAPMAYMDERSWKRMSATEQLWFMVDMVVPWYFNFYCGWMTSPLVQAGHVHVNTYEAMLRDPVAALATIHRFLGETSVEDDLQDAVAACRRKKTRKNKGVSGRGSSELSAEQKDRIRRYASYYPDIDFSPLGISTAARPAAA